MAQLNTRRIGLSPTAEEFAIVEAAAKANGESVAGYCLRAALAGFLVPSAEPLSEQLHLGGLAAGERPPTAPSATPEQPIVDIEGWDLVCYRLEAGDGFQDAAAAARKPFGEFCDAWNAAAGHYTEGDADLGRRLMAAHATWQRYVGDVVTGRVRVEKGGSVVQVRELEQARRKAALYDVPIPATANRAKWSKFEALEDGATP